MNITVTVVVFVIKRAQLHGGTVAKRKTQATNFSTIAPAITIEVVRECNK